MRKPFLLASLTCPGLSVQAEIPPQHYDYSYQLYQEDDNRIRIESHYLRGNLDLDDATSIRFQWLTDAVSGASPTGALPGSTQPFYSNVEDVRDGILGAISRRIGDHRVELELSRSVEDDYRSKGIALSDTIELNQKNTTLSFGVNWLDDKIAVPGLSDRKKNTLDWFAGINQILDTNTTVSANLTIGYSDGYLNDPYKVVQRTDMVTVPDGMGGFITIPVDNLYRENRPDSRLRQVLQLQARHYFEPVDAAIDGTLRLSHDDYGVFSQTLQIEWRQAIGEKFEVTPFFRYYHQNAADFYVRSLDGLPIGTPAADPNGSGIHYSADYRLSSFQAISGGIKLNYRFNDTIAASASYERYVMSGTGSDRAPDAAYASANLWTFGLSLSF